MINKTFIKSLLNIIYKKINMDYNNDIHYEYLTLRD